MKQLPRVNRRGFLKTSGLAGAVPLAAQPAKSKPILITSGGGRLAGAGCRIKETYWIRLTERAPVNRA